MRIHFLFPLLLIINSPIYGSCILHSFFDPKDKIWKDHYECSSEILDQTFSPGSIFKIFIVSAGFYFNILQEKDIPFINQYMKESNNEYFKNLVKKMNHSKMIQFLNVELKEFFYNKSISKNHFKDDFSFVHGGSLKFSPREIHNWFKYFTFSQKKYIQLALQTIKRKEQDITYYAKSGTWGGTAWFCGIIELENFHVICALNLYTKDWNKAKIKSENDFLNQLKEIIK